MAERKAGRGRIRSTALPEERRRSIIELVRTRPLVRADELASRLGVSIETIRRDLSALEQAGLTRRVYGGVTRPPAHSFEPPFEQRRIANADAKQAMARLAVSLVYPDSTVVLDIGTSVAEVARQLPPDFHGRVITNSILVTAELSGRAGIELLLTGGRVRSGDGACYGPHAETLLDGFYGGIAFLGSGGVHPAIGLTDHHIDEIPSRRIIIDHADEVYVLADSSKLGQVAPAKVCDLSVVSGVITDDRAEPALRQAFADAGVRLLVASTLASTGTGGAEGVRMA